MITHTMIGFQLNYFLLEQQVQPSTVGGILLLGRFWDAMMDPTVGVMTTLTRSRWGSLKPWIFGSILPLLTSFVAMWSVPPQYDAKWEKPLFVTCAYLMYVPAHFVS